MQFISNTGLLTAVQYKITSTEHFLFRAVGIRGFCWR
jgi:hypothetical protein